MDVPLVVKKAVLLEMHLVVHLVSSKVVKMVASKGVK